MNNNISIVFALKLLAALYKQGLVNTATYQNVLKQFS